MSKVLFIFGFIVIILIAGAFSYTFYNSSKSAVEIKGHAFQVELAKTDKEKQVGLSKYKSIPQERGMLFIFDKPEFYSFWMKEMKFPIDIIFINNSRIVTIYQNLPIDNLNIYSPTSPSDKVLEINANISKKYGFGVGDSVIFKNIK